MRKRSKIAAIHIKHKDGTKAMLKMYETQKWRKLKIESKWHRIAYSAKVYVYPKPFSPPSSSSMQKKDYP